MRVALLADAGSVHTQRWALALSRLGVDLHLWSERDWPGRPTSIGLTGLPRLRRGRVNLLANVGIIRRGLKRFQPNLVHAHYVSHFGLYGALSGYRPLILSVWGADVEVFPTQKPWITQPLLRYILSRADAISASSRYLKEVTERYTSRVVTVIPFGVDMDRFRSRPAQTGPLRWIVNKALEHVYGIDLLIEAWARVGVNGAWYGRILGEGRQGARLQDMVRRLGLEGRIEFLGKVPMDHLADALAWADIGLYPSRRESFGVAPLEMMALGRAVVASRLGGLTEVIDEGVTGYTVEPGNLDAWVRILRDAVENPDHYRMLGLNGPKWVGSRYNFEDNVSRMMRLYQEIAEEG